MFLVSSPSIMMTKLGNSNLVAVEALAIPPRLALLEMQILVNELLSRTTDSILKTGASKILTSSLPLLIFDIYGYLNE